MLFVVLAFLTAVPAHFCLPATGPNPIPDRITDPAILADRTNICNDETITSCRSICLQYTSWNLNTGYCTERKTRTGDVYAYWTMLGCHSWSQSELNCQYGGGDLASFLDMDDRIFATEYVDGFDVGEEPCYNAQSPSMNGVWVNLQKRTAENQWYWGRGMGQFVQANSRYPIAFNDKVVYSGSNPVVSAGTCGMMAWTGQAADGYTYTEGYYGADCSTSARAVCMKKFATTSSPIME